MAGTLTGDISTRRAEQIERRLNELGSLVKGNQSFQADRISDVIEQIDELRGEVQGLSERVERMAQFLNKRKEKSA